ncbi:MAG: thioredoxin-dependent thiol peroxidase [Myxococcales bacterium]|nr:thioredoxin-dependent thiol peroxidase [Myxococcales bacterium]
MIQEKDIAPDFKLLSDGGTAVSLADFRGKKVVLYFYPKDNTPGCTQEACDFRDNFDQLTKSGVIVIGISPDSVGSHEKFKSKYELPFILLSDPDKHVHEAYGAWGEKNMYGKKVMGVIRSTFLIDDTGIIRRIWRNVKVNGHIDAILSEIESR